MPKYIIGYTIKGEVQIEAPNAGAAQRQFEQFTPEHLGAVGELKDVDSPEKEEDQPYRKMKRTA